VLVKRIDAQTEAAPNEVLPPDEAEPPDLVEESDLMRPVARCGMQAA
jgi:hypothetical protein